MPAERIWDEPAKSKEAPIMSTLFDTNDVQDDPRTLLNQFILWIFFVVLFYAVFDTVMALIYRDAAIAVCGVSFYLYCGLLLFVRSRLGQWTLETASIVAGGGLLIQGLVIAFAYPDAAPAAGMVPLIVVAMLLFYHTGQRLFNLIIIAGAASLVITFIAAFMPVWTTGPNWLRIFYKVNSIPAVAVLVLVLLWQFHKRLDATLAQLRRTNLTLQEHTLALRREIEKRKHTEAQLEAKNETLEAQNAELERFTYTVSHDLKNPIVTIKGFLGLLRQDALTGDTESMERDIARIGAATDKMARLLNELLELSRIGRQTNPPEEVCLSELAHEAVELVDGLITPQAVTIDIDPQLPVVFGDRLRLLEVYQNLIDNAVKFMGCQPAPRVEIGAQRKHGQMHYYVRDNGIGIEPKYHEKVFGLFDRLDQQIDGTGIGLALVRRIVEAHGGTIWVESAGREQGSTFYFTLPPAEAAA